MSSRYQKAHAQSQVLSDIENENIFTALGRGCQSLSTAVVELYLADATNHHEWNKRCCGVACLVKDNPQQSYFIRLFDPKTCQMVWEQELYNHFAYKIQSEHFHTFEAHDCQAGLNFASEMESAHFKKMVEKTLWEREHKYKVDCSAIRLVVTVKNYPQKKDKGTKGRKKRPKEDISAPTDMSAMLVGTHTRVLTSWEMKTLFEQIGIEQSTVDEETIAFIYDFVDKNGGIEALRKEIAQQQSNPLPTTAIEKRSRVPTPPPATEDIPDVPSPRPPKMEDKADVSSPSQVRRHVRRRLTPPQEIDFQYTFPLSSQGAMSVLEKSADVFPIPQYVPGRRFVRPDSGELHIFQSDTAIGNERVVPHSPPEMEDIADIAPSPARRHVQRHLPPRPESQFQYASPLSSQGAISVSEKSADVLTVPQYVAGRRFGRAFESGELHIFPSDNESNNSTVDGISPGKANTSSELQNPLLQDCEVVDNEALYESDVKDDNDDVTGCDFVDEWSD